MKDVRDLHRLDAELCTDQRVALVDSHPLGIRRPHIIQQPHCQTLKTSRPSDVGDGTGELPWRNARRQALRLASQGMRCSTRWGKGGDCRQQQP